MFSSYNSDAPKVTITGDSFEMNFDSSGSYYYPNGTLLTLRDIKSKNFMKFKLNRGYVSLFKTIFCKYNFIKINCAFIFIVLRPYHSGIILP